MHGLSRGDNLGGGRRFRTRARSHKTDLGKNVSEFGAARLAAGGTKREGVLQNNDCHAGGSDARLVALFKRSRPFSVPATKSTPVECIDSAGTNRLNDHAGVDGADGAVEERIAATTPGFPSHLLSQKGVATIPVYN